MSEYVAAQADVAKSNEPPRKWWNWHLCPLVPQIRTRQEDRHNTWSFHFHWLLFRAWTSDAPTLGVNAEIETYGAHLRFHFPYLWAGIFIPFGMYVDSWIHRHLWRKTKFQRNGYKEV